MLLLDTHAWIWWENADPKLSRAAARALTAAKEVGVAAVSCWELAMLVARGRLRLDRDATRWMTESLARPNVVLMPLTPEIAVRAAAFGDALHGDPMDRILAATAIQHGLQLVTKDERVRGLPGLRCLW